MSSRTDPVVRAMPSRKSVRKFSTLLISSILLSAFSPTNVFADEAVKTKAPIKATEKTTEKQTEKETENDLLLKQERFQAPKDWNWNTFTNADGAKIRYGYALADENPHGTIVLVTGFTEFSEVYFETIRDMLKKRWNVYAMDWRGEGGSDRYLDDREKAYSLGFNHDSNDLAQLIETAIKPVEKKKIVLVGHSLGSMIALRFLHDHPGMVNKAILSAPAVDFIGKQDPNLVGLMCWWQLTTGNGKKYLDNQGNWAYMEPKVSKMETHSHDPERVRLEAAWADKNAELRSGGATWEWLDQYAKSLSLIWSDDYLKKIDIPVIVGIPGDDAIIRPYKQRQCVRKIPKVELWEAEGGRHDLFLESDDIRGPFLQRALDFARI